MMLKITLSIVLSTVFMFGYSSQSRASGITPEMTKPTPPTNQLSQTSMANEQSKRKQSATLKLAKTYKGFSSPTGIAADRHGNLYVSNWGIGTVTKIDFNGKSSTFIEDLGSPAGLAFDATGNLYVADYTKDVIYKVKPTGEKTVFAKGLHTPTGISFNKAGVLLVSNRGSNEIVKIDSSGKIRLVAKGLKTPVGVVEDSAGNIYVTNYGGDISLVTPSGIVKTFSNDFGRPGVGIDINSKNQIFAADNGDGCVRLILADGSTKIVVDDIGGCVALLVHNNTLYVGSWSTGAVYAYTIE